MIAFIECNMINKTELLPIDRTRSTMRIIIVND